MGQLWLLNDFSWVVRSAPYPDCGPGWVNLLMFKTDKKRTHQKGNFTVDYLRKTNNKHGAG